MNDVFLCDGIRTPIGRYGGALASVRTDDLAALPLKALVERNPSADWAAVDDVYFGCANQAGEDNRNVARMVVEDDEHPRETTLEPLARLKGVVTPDGTVTPGNASGINDGSVAVLIASERAVARHGLMPRARVLGAATAGVAPRIMGIGPAPATRKLLQRHGLAVSDIDVIELNEAFAAQALAVTRQLGLPDDAPHVNPNGGAIALGHPLGASGARILWTATRQLAASGGRYAVATMCIGVGQGIAVLVERV